jgi:hypothetical protein
VRIVLSNKKAPHPFAQEMKLIAKTIATKDHPFFSSAFPPPVLSVSGSRVFSQLLLIAPRCNFVAQT